MKKTELKTLIKTLIQESKDEGVKYDSKFVVRAIFEELEEVLYEMIDDNIVNHSGRQDPNLDSNLQETLTAEELFVELFETKEYKELINQCISGKCEAEKLNAQIKALSQNSDVDVINKIREDADELTADFEKEIKEYMEDAMEDAR